MDTLDIEDSEALVAWLKRRGHIGKDETPELRVLRGGVSNRTVWVGRGGKGCWVLKQALERLRVETEWRCSADRIYREAEGMRWLATLAPPGSITNLVFEDRGEHVLGMHAVPEPHSNWKTTLLSGNVGSDELRKFGQLLGAIHRNAKLAGSRLRETFADRRYFESLRLEPFYEYTAETVPEAGPFLRELAAETRSIELTLVHGDYSPKNILVHRGELVLLDHEVIHWGDPMFDVGFAVAHLLCKAHHVRSLRETFAGAALLFWEHYRFSTCGCLAPGDSARRAARHAMACLLARAAGRSPVEYLGADARKRQVAVVASLVQRPPATLLELTDAFLEGLNRSEQTANP